ncbi:D-inositol-3-phosphate glycosyltransferase [bacterium BMS3Abin01]|nr:D-inositol-3-phosphate glycosyltransferase [bacterium BMS3Abin01]
MPGGNITLGIISHQRISDSMAGPGIRCWEFARALADTADVRLFSPEESDLTPKGFDLITYSDKTLVKQVSSCDAILCQGFILNNFPAIKKLGKYLIVDLYVPMALEALAQFQHAGLPEQNATQENVLSAIIEQLAFGNFFICASKRQRDYWLGLLSAAGRVDPVSFNNDQSLYQLIDVVPFGLPDKPPVATGKVLKGVYPGIGAGDKILLWGGGVYNWLDPFTPIRAVASLAKKRGDIKLFFMGTGHPDPNVPRMRAYDEALLLSRELGVLNSSVFFNDRWVAYKDRVNFLLESDLGVNANIDHIETRFSFRTRILDCIWSSLPIVSTYGDSLSSMVQHRKLGLVTRPGDARAYADAIERLLDDDELRSRCSSNLRTVAAEFHWSETTQPIKRFLKSIAYADRNDATVSRLAISIPGPGKNWSSRRRLAGCFKRAAGRIKRRLP